MPSLPMADAMASMESAGTDMSDLKTKVTTLDSAVPGAFDTARDDYLKAIDDRSAQIETVFQNDLNRASGTSISRRPSPPWPV